MRKVFIITERRADYSRFKPILKKIKFCQKLDYDLVVTGMHLLKNHGNTIREIESDGFKIFDKFEMFLEAEDSNGAMVRAYAEAVKQVSFALERSSPDIILSGFDIAANAAVTLAGAHMNIPVAHIQGGEVTGTIDESIRHSMSKFAHYHFVANHDARERLIKMGEVPSTVFDVGCPSIDAIIDIADDKSIVDRYNMEKPYFLVLQHPVTTEFDQSRRQIDITLEALKKTNVNALIILPNNDAGYAQIIKSINNSKLKSVETLSVHAYANLLKNCTGLIGNSSSGIHEAATFNIPVVNIGSRQNGRLRPENVIDVDHDIGAIIQGINECKRLKKKKQKFSNPYGDGRSSARIVDLLNSINISRNIVQKRMAY